MRLFGGECNSEGGHRIGEVVGLGCADERGALTTGFLSTHAIAVCAMDTPRASAIRSVASMMAFVAVESQRVAEHVGRWVAGRAGGALLPPANCQAHIDEAPM